MRIRPGVPLAILWLLIAAFWVWFTLWAVDIGGLLGLWALVPALGSVAVARALFVGDRHWRRLTLWSVFAGAVALINWITNQALPAQIPLTGAALCAASAYAYWGFRRTPTSRDG